MFIKTIIQVLKKLKELSIMYLNSQSLPVFLDVTKFADFWCKTLMPAELKGIVT